MSTAGNLIAAATAGAVLALGAAWGLDAATPEAEAQGGFTATPAQLRINQKISQAAVRRSNAALNALRPVRPAPGSGASDDTAGAKPGTGTGWPTGAIADDAVTSSKLSPEVRAQLGAGGSSGGTAPSPGIGGIPAGGALAGTYPDPSLAAGAVGADQLGVPLAANLSGPFESVPQNTTVVLDLDAPAATIVTNDFDTGGFLDTTMPEGITFPRPGIYRIGVRVVFQGAPADTTRSVGYLRTGPSGLAAETILVTAPASSDAVTLAGSLLLPAATGDRFQLRASHGVAGNVPVRALGLDVEYLGSGPG